MGVDGTWNITMNTQMGAQNATLTLKNDGGKLTGSIASPQGTLDINDGSVDGDTAKFKAELTQPMAITLEVTAKVDGDNISGDVQMGSFGSANFTGTRA